MRKLNRTAVAIVGVQDQPIPMRDGVLLRADIQRPDSGEPVPTLLARNPYGQGAGRMVPVAAALEAGFAVVIQNCRGRGSSDGAFEPWAAEPADGADTVSWITAQPWSNGKVVGYGLSYLAGTALQTAIERPNGYVGVVAMQTPADFYDDLTYVGGALALGSAQGWATLQGMLDGQHAMLAGEDPAPILGAALPAMFQPGAARAALPLRDSVGLPAAAPYWAEWLDHPTRDEYWQRFAAPRDHYAEIGLPGYHVAGWYDLFLAGTLENYQGLLAQNPQQVLVIGPWTHGAIGVSGAGELDFGPGSAATILQVEADQLAFLHGLATAGTPGGQRPPVRVFVMGENAWREEQEWPLARTSYTPWYFQASGGLDLRAPAAETEPWRFDSDPSNPVPTVGGSLLFPEFNAAGPHDQQILDSRTDILRFVSAPLERDLEVTGPVKVILRATTSGPTTDWTAKLIDMHPDGRAYNLADGILRTSKRPGDEYTIDLVATSNLFKAGHRVRVDIASSNFPRFDRNPQNGTLSAAATASDLTVQHQTVLPGSHIVLPVIPR